MAEPTTARPGIDPTMQALLEAFPFKFTSDDGVEVAREQMRQLKAPPEAVPDMRIEERTIDYGDITGIPVRTYWPPIAQHDNLPVVVFYHGGGWALGDLDTHDPVARAHAVGAEAIVVSVVPAGARASVPAGHRRLVGGAAVGRRARGRTRRRPGPYRRRRRLGGRQHLGGDGAAGPR
jgi:alpha/beta hydrolase fold